MDNVQIRQTDLWKINVFNVEMPYYDSIKEQVKDFVYNVQLDKPSHNAGDKGYLNIGPHAQRHKKNLQESYPNLFEDNSNEAFNEVKDFCSRVTLDIAKTINRQYTNTDHWMIRVVESWYHVTKDGGYHDYHTHTHVPWCGIFYVDVGDSNVETQNGVNRFYTPLTIPPLKGLEYINHTWHDSDMTNGTLVVFPGYLPHSAMLYRGSKDRIIIAFNAEIGDARDFRS